MKENKTGVPWGEMLIPGIAVIYSLASVIEQAVLGMEWKTLLYSLVLTGGIIVCAAVNIIRTLFKRVEVRKDEVYLTERRKSRNRILIFIAWSAVFTVSFEFLGYLITIPLLVFWLFKWLGMTDWRKNAAACLVMSIAVHFIFVKWSGMILPQGILKHLLD